MRLTPQLFLELAAMEHRFCDLYNMAYVNYPQSQELILSMTFSSYSWTGIITGKYLLILRFL